MGDIILLGDFNAWTRDLQTPIHDRSSDWSCTSESDHASLGLQHTSEDHMGPLSTYGRYIFQLCESSNLVILNGLPCFLGSELFTCRPHGGGASVVDYALACVPFIPSIHSFTVTHLPLADHALLCLTLRFTHRSLSPLLFHPPSLVPRCCQSVPLFVFASLRVMVTFSSSILDVSFPWLIPSCLVRPPPCSIFCLL